MAPHVHAHPILSARELLDRGAEKIWHDHEGEPELQAEMMTVLGSVYHHLNLNQPAVELLRQANALQARQRDVRPVDRATTMAELKGSAEISSRPGVGTQLSLRIPADYYEAL